ncbi:hypothetical protein JCM31271_01200 [Halorubrum trueperi]
MPKPNSPRREGEDLSADPASNAYTSKFGDEIDKSPSLCVVEAVAEATETDPKELQPLYEAIDPDALNQFFESPHQFRSGHILFRFAGCNVTVDADGWIAVSSRIPKRSDEK